MQVKWVDVCALSVLPSGVNPLYMPEFVEQPDIAKKMDGIEIELEPQIKQTGGQIKQQQTNKQRNANVLQDLLNI